MLFVLSHAAPPGTLETAIAGRAPWPKDDAANARAEIDAIDVAAVAPPLPPLPLPPPAVAAIAVPLASSAAL